MDDMGEGSEAPQESFSPVVLVRACMLFFLLWLNFAFFRTIDAPADMPGRFVHYVVPFSIAATAMVAALLVVRRGVRVVSLRAVYAVVLPSLFASYALLSAAPEIPVARIAAYTFNFLSMCLSQLAMWIAAAKIARHSPAALARIYGWLAATEGTGAALGVALGEFFARRAWITFPAPVAIALLGAASLAALAVFSRLSSRMSRGEARPNPRPSTDGGAAVRWEDEATADDVGGVAGAAQDAARSMAALHDLFEREQQVLALLLAGRSRPYIRDHLGISINTVNAHVRHIYAKCEVHSLQEAIDAAGDVGHCR